LAFSTELANRAVSSMCLAGLCDWSSASGLGGFLLSFRVICSSGLRYVRSAAPRLLDLPALHLGEILQFYNVVRCPATERGIRHIQCPGKTIEDLKFGISQKVPKENPPGVNRRAIPLVNHF
jgi:hypothetical protein